MHTSLEHFLTILFSAILVIGVVGNSLVIYILRFKSKRHLSTMEYLINILAVMDLIASTVNPSLYIYWNVTKYKQWHFGTVGCKILPALLPITVAMSLGMILIITLDRCRVICQPFEPNYTKRQVTYAVIVLVILSILCELPYAVYSTVIANNKVTLSCKNKINENSYQLDFITSSPCSNQLAVLIDREIHHHSKAVTERLNEYYQQKNSSFMVPPTVTNCRIHSRQCRPNISSLFAYIESGIMISRTILYVVIFVVSNVLIYRHLYDKETEMHLKGQTTLSNRKNTFQLLIVMATVFLLLVFPKDMFYLIVTLSPSFEVDQTLRNINSILKLFQVANSICNPFIYARLHKSIRSEFSSDISRQSKATLMSANRTPMINTDSSPTNMSPKGEPLKFFTHQYESNI